MNTASEKVAAGFIGFATFIGCLSGSIFIGYIISIMLGGVEHGSSLPPGWHAIVPFIPWVGIAAGIIIGTVVGWRFLRSARRKRTTSL